MKKACVLVAVLSLLAGSALAAKTQPAKSAPAPQPVATAQPEASVSAANSTESWQGAAAKQIDSMNPGLAYNFLMDLKLFDITNPSYAVSPAPISSNWYFYTIYRAMVANVFNNGVGIYADVEKPGYAGVTYPTLKVNELFAKYKRGMFYIKAGRQTLGDTDDLLLGFQNDAVRIGFDVDNMDLAAFIARTDLKMPWNDSMDGMFGLIPTFNFGSTMGVRGYVLIGTEPITVTTSSATTDNINSLILVGGKYFMGMPMGDAGKLDLAAQLGIQFAMATTAANVAYDATSLGMKLDGGYGMNANDNFGFNIKAHVVYTGGTDNSSNTKCGFASPNALVGSGPGLFDKIQDGAGPYTYVDDHFIGARLQQYASVFAFGASFDCDIIKAWEPGVGFWIYSDTNKDGKALGFEQDLWLTYKLSSMVSFYGQEAMFIPNNQGGPSLGSTLKLVLGTALTF